MTDIQTADSLSADSMTVDAPATDSLAQAIPHEGLLLTDGVASAGKAPQAPDTGISWILAGIAVLFCLIGLRFRNSARYLRALVSDLTQTRTRQNAFDETVDETSFLFLLNLLWAACAGILLWFFVSLENPPLPGNSFSIPDRPEAGIPLCMAICLTYLLLILAAYRTVGTVFADARHARLWVKGATASYALCSILFFPLALLALCYPEWTEILLQIAVLAFILTKIIFICQGFRIFFTHFSSWLLFLYYLCSLEIVPLTITYAATLRISSFLL